jgi:acyl carrier protein
MDVSTFITRFTDTIDGVEPGSLAILVTIVMIEDEYGVDLTGEQLEKCQTVEDVWKLVWQVSGNASRKCT